MSYIRQEWYNGEIIAEELLNHMEAGIEDSSDRLDNLVSREATAQEINDAFSDVFGGTFTGGI